MILAPTESNMYSAIDFLLDKLDSPVLKYKESTRNTLSKCLRTTEDLFKMQATAEAYKCVFDTSHFQSYQGNVELQTFS